MLQYTDNIHSSLIPHHETLKVHQRKGEVMHEELYRMVDAKAQP